MKYLLFAGIYCLVYFPVSWYVLRPIIYLDPRRRKILTRQLEYGQVRFPQLRQLPAFPTLQAAIIRTRIVLTLLYLPIVFLFFL